MDAKVLHMFYIMLLGSTMDSTLCIWRQCFSKSAISSSFFLKWAFVGEFAIFPSRVYSM